MMSTTARRMSGEKPCVIRVRGVSRNSTSLTICSRTSLWGGGGSLGCIYPCSIYSRPELHSCSPAPVSVLIQFFFGLPHTFSLNHCFQSIPNILTSMGEGCIFLYYSSFIIFIQLLLCIISVAALFCVASLKYEDRPSSLGHKACVVCISGNLCKCFSSQFFTVSL